MKVLAIDTSTSYLSVAIRCGDSLIAERNLRSPMEHSSRLIPLIAESLALADLSIEAIDGFAVSIGPGSFTGLRIGVATIKGLAFATQKPIVGVPTLDVLAENITETAYYICPILDAKRHQLYTSFYEQSGQGLKRLTDYLVIGIDDLLKKVRKKTIFLGDGLLGYRDVIEKSKIGMAIFAPRDQWFPKASVVARYGIVRLKAGKAGRAHDLTPLYLRPPEAEEKLAARSSARARKESDTDYVNFPS